MPGGAGTWMESEGVLAGYVRDIYGKDLGGREVLMRAREEGARLVWYPAQVNTSIRPGWFYLASEDGRVRSLAELLGVYYGSVGGNGQFLLNIPPDRRGLFHENDVARLKEFGEVLGRTFGRDLAEGGRVEAAVAGGAGVGDVGALLGGGGCWMTTEGARSAVVTVELAGRRDANCVMLQEPIETGQRVEGFEVEVRVGGLWEEVARGTVIGYKRLVRFEERRGVEAVRVRLTGFRMRGALSRVGLFFGPRLEEEVRVADGGVSREKWRVAGCSGQDGEGGRAEHAMDGNVLTLWRTGAGVGPHFLAVDMGEVVEVRGFVYVPRQDVEAEGIVIRGRFEVSEDGERWEVVVAGADFDNVVNSRQRQEVRLVAGVRARFFRMTALRTAGEGGLVREGGAASAAEVSVLVD